MHKSEERNLLRFVSVMIGLIALGCGTRIASATFSSRFMTLTAVVNSKAILVPFVTDCDGDACGQVTLTWDDTKQQYKAQNNSTSQWVRVDAANLAATATICVAAGQAEYLSLKSIVAYHANYDANCANPVE